MCGARGGRKYDDLGRMKMNNTKGLGEKREKKMIVMFSILACLLTGQRAHGDFHFHFLT